MNHFEEEMSYLEGYKPKTTFYDDLTAADKYGESVIAAMCEKAFEESKEDEETIGELGLVLQSKYEFFTKIVKLPSYAAIYKMYCEEVGKWIDKHYGNPNQITSCK